jgi:hypothetical protein
MGNYMSNQLSYRHTQRVVVAAAMDAGGCGDEFCKARKACSKKKKKFDEVRRCMDAMAALRRCLEGNKPHFKNYIEVMDEGLDYDEGREWRSSIDRWRWRWWTGMIRIPQPPPPKNIYSF